MDNKAEQKYEEENIQARNVTGTSKNGHRFVKITRWTDIHDSTNHERENVVLHPYGMDK